MHMTGGMVKELRVALDESQRVFAKRFGVSYRSISHWENGRSISSSSKEKLVKLYKKTLPEHAAEFDGPEGTPEGTQPKKGKRKPKVRSVTTMTEVLEGANPFKATSAAAKGGRHALRVVDVHEAIADFREQLRRDHLTKAIEYVSNKYGMPRITFRSAFAMFLYLLSESQGSMTLEELRTAVSGHEETN